MVADSWRLPGRTANDVKNYWNTHMRSKVVDHSQAHSKKEETERVKPHEVIKPVPRTLSKASSGKLNIIANSADQSDSCKVNISSEGASSSGKNWWETLLDQLDDEDNTTFSLAEGNDLGEDDSKVLCDFLTEDQTWSDFLFDVHTKP
ncbi:Myb domain [Sesbania bispinosa]|nr:Myb domain [Sesbania bispinosa]